MKVAIIPARSGSKRIKDKNIKDFCGKPIIAYAIDSARKAGIFDKVIVSTDSAKIAKIAESYGADSANLRDSALSDDYTSTLEVMSYEVKRLNLAPSDIVCCIYPTTPLLRAEFLRQGLENLTQNAYCFSACVFNSHPFRAFFIRENRLKMLDKSYEFTRSQDLEMAYYDAGQFYFGYATHFASKKSIFSEDSSVVVLPSINVVDINTPDDWEIAEIRYKILCER